MTAAAGSIAAVIIAGRHFSATANAEAELYLGGWVNRTETNGDRTTRIVQTWSSWSLTGAVLSIEHNRGDLEYLIAAKAEAGVLELVSPTANYWLGGGEEISGLRKFYPIDIELVDGTTYSGKGLPVGKISYNTMNGTAAVDFEGDGRLSQA